jgi:hypothetical protein
VFVCARLVERSVYIEQAQTQNLSLAMKFIDFFVVCAYLIIANAYGG